MNDKENYSVLPISLNQHSINQKLILVTSILDFLTLFASYILLIRNYLLIDVNQNSILIITF